MQPSSDYMEAFDRGYRLAKRLPFSYFMSYTKTGFAVRHIDPHNFNPDDVVEKSWQDIDSPMQFQQFLDELTDMIMEGTNGLDSAIARAMR